MRKRLMTALLSALLLMSCAACSPEEPVMPVPQLTSETALERPELGENYYGYINFDYLSNGQIPYNKESYGTFDKIGDALENDINEIVSQCLAGEYEKGSKEQMIRDLYSQCIDTEKRESDGAALLLAAAGMIEGCETTDELVSVLGTIYNEYGVSSFFRFVVRSDFYDTSVPRLMLMMANSCGNMKENFTKTDAGIDKIGSLTYNTLTAMEVDIAQADKRAKNVVKMVNDFAVATLDSSEMYNIEKHYNLYKTEDLSNLLTNVDVKKLMTSFGFDTSELVVYDVSNIEKVNEYFTQEHIRELKDYAMACLMFEYQDALPETLINPNSTSESTKEQKEHSAKTFIAAELEEEIGYLYGQKTCTDEVMNAAERMRDDIVNSCRDLIKNSSRMSDDAKNKCLKKLDNITFLIGYNKELETHFDITPSDEGGSFLGNIIAIHKSKAAVDKEKLSHPVNKKTWAMSPIEVNAVYSRENNTITIPAVMLSEAFFDIKKGEYYVLGTLGYTIAHEMNHAFDADGFKYDENGCYKPDWLEEKDREAYQQVLDKAEQYYNNYKILGVYSINGKQTLAENTADLGAVQCLLNTTDDKEKLQQICEGIAVGWASLNLVTGVVMQISGDEHSPSEARVNAVLSSSDQFYKAYDIKETDKMYVSPENRIKVW